MEQAAAHSAKRPGEHDDSTPRKLSKTSHPTEDDFSTSVRKKLSVSSRTGQACDRCKIRKIKCDGNPDGCSPCQQAQHICKTTDRNNGRTTVRGHADRLEWENRWLKEKLMECQQQLRDHGVPVEDQTQSSSYPPDYPASGRSQSQSWRNNQTQETGQHYPPLDSPNTYHAPAVDAAGSAPANAGLSILNGTSLSLFGMHIDVVKFSNAHSDPNAPTAYETFIRYAFGQEKAPSPALPSTLDEAKKFAWWYFRSLNPYLPLLDKRDFASLLARYYDPSISQPLTAAEDVMIHMVLGEIKYQHGQRNNYAPFLDQGIAHYKYSLTRFNELLRSRTLEDIQAMLLIAFKLRNFPKPGAAWMGAQMVIEVGLEINLHRSADALPEDVQKTLTPHTRELRKRVFWTAYALIVGLSGKLGLPLPVRIEDIDIEIPEPIHDNLPDEVSLAEEHKCSFQVGIAAMRLLAAVQVPMYSNLLGIRRSGRTYAAEVVRLESEMQKWKSSLPPELTDPARASREWKVYALYVQFWELETRFLLRHPVIHSTTNPEMYARNAKVSLDVSAELLKVVNEIHVLKSLDIPWINTTVFLASIFTTLFIQDRRQDEITQEELSKLEGDMNLWLSIFQDVGRMLGTGHQLADSTRNVVDNVLGSIKRRITAKTAAAVAVQALNQSTQGQEQPAGRSSTYGSGQYAPVTEPSVSSEAVKTESRAGDYIQGEPTSLQSGQQPYSQSRPSPPYNYPEPSMNNPSAYQANQTQYSQQLYAASAAEQIPAQHVQQLTAQTNEGAGGNSNLYSMESSANAIYYTAQATTQNLNPASDWLRWSQMNVAINPPHSDGPQEFVNSANALVALGGGNAATQDSMQAPAPTAEDASNWPLNIFNTGQQNGTAGG